MQMAVAEFAVQVVGLVVVPNVGQPLVVAPPFESVQRLAAVPETVPAVKSAVSVPCAE